MAETSPSGSKAKKLFKGPLIYLILAPIIVVIGWSLLSGAGVREISVERGFELLEAGDVTKAEIIDGDQRVNLTLAEADKTTGATDVFFYYVSQRGTAVIDAINEAAPADGYTDQVPQPSAFWSIMGFLLPLLLIGLFFWWMLSSMQGGGNKVMQFGKSRAKLISKDTPQVTFVDVASAD